jgi:adenylate cyclase
MTGLPTLPRLARWRTLRPELKQFANNAVSLLARIGADPDDDDELRLKKSLLVLGSVLFLFAGFGWGVMYFFFGARLAGAIPFSYGVISLLSVTLFGVTRRYRFFRFSQLILILLLQA